MFLIYFIMLNLSSTSTFDANDYNTITKTNKRIYGNYIKTQLSEQKKTLDSKRQLLLNFTKSNYNHIYQCLKDKIKEQKNLTIHIRDQICYFMSITTLQNRNYIYSDYSEFLKNLKTFYDRLIGWLNDEIKTLEEKKTQVYDIYEELKRQDLHKEVEKYLTILGIKNYFDNNLTIKNDLINNLKNFPVFKTSDFKLENGILVMKFWLCIVEYLRNQLDYETGYINNFQMGLRI